MTKPVNWHYNTCTKVQSSAKVFHYCFGYLMNIQNQKKTTFYIFSPLTEEEIHAYFEELPFDFKYSFEEEKYHNNTRIKVTLPLEIGNYQEVILKGNLIKGASEFAYITEEFLKLPKEDFFTRWWKAFKSIDRFDLLTYEYNGNHTFFSIYHHSLEERPYPVTTIEKALENLKTRKPRQGIVWDTVLK